MESVRLTERHQLHFDLGAGPAANEVLTLHVAMREYPLVPHSTETLLKARQANPILGFYAGTEVSHFVDAELPQDAIALMSVTRRVVVDDQPADAIVGLAIHVPRQGRLAEAQAAFARQDTPVAELPPKLALRQGVNADASLLRVLAERPDLLHDVFDPFETATALLYQHPGLINLKGPSFASACLLGADFTGASLVEAVLTNATLAAAGTITVTLAPRGRSGPSVALELDYDPTKLAPSITGPKTRCPDGQPGACTAAQLSTRVPAEWVQAG